MKVFAFDTETYLIGPGAVAPKMVCFSVSDGENTFLVGNGDETVVEDLRSLFQLGHLLVGHNVAYDCAVIALSYPELEPLIWAKYAAGEIVCTKLQEQLINLGTHGKLNTLTLPDGSNEKILYGLAVLESRYLGIDRSAQKEGPDTWRLNYSLLDGKTADEYPPDAASYAMDDALGTFLVYTTQLSRAADGILDTASFQAYKDFALFLTTIRGMATDKEAVETLRVNLAQALNPSKLRPLVEAGILRPGRGIQPHVRSLARALQILGKDEAPEDWEPYRITLEVEGIKFSKAVKSSVDTEVLKHIIKQICLTYGKDPKLTATGAICTDAEVLQDLDGLDDVLDVYKERQSLQKLVTTEIPRMEWQGELADTVHFPFRALVETGRTSSYANKLFPSGSGQQMHPRIRPCYRARDGHVLLSTDYSTLELATVGQRMIDLFGQSVHADKINNGQDLHAFLAARLAFELHVDFRQTCDDQSITTNDGMYQAFMECKGHPELNSFYKWWRAFAKPVGLGYPGALGPWTFLSFAKAQHGIDVAEIAEKMPDSNFEVNDDLLTICQKKLNIPVVEFRWTPQTKAVALAIKLKEIWLDTFAMRPYFQYIKDNHKDSRNPVIGQYDDGHGIQGYTYTSDFGMVRRGCSYPAACNGYAMQTPAAEGATAAGILIMRACRDVTQESILYQVVHPVDFIHDEWLTEHQETDAKTLDAQAQEVSRLMLEAMALIAPDVPGLSTEAVFMRSWDKFAEPTFNEDGQLIVTEPATVNV